MLWHFCKLDTLNFKQMKPIEMTADNFKEVQDKEVLIRYLYRNKTEAIDITGVIREVYLAMNPPNLPGSFDFQISERSKRVMQNTGIEVPKNIAIYSVSKIELLQ